MVDIHLIKSIEYTTPRVNPNTNYELWVSLIRQCRFTDCNKCITLVQDVDRGEGCACLGNKIYYGNSVLSNQFYNDLKTALNNEVY